jgi:tetratricopeptide (TPR) repeat protein
MIGAMMCAGIVLAVSIALAGAQPPAQPAPADATKQSVAHAQKLIQSGDVAGAVAMLEKTVASAPQSFDAHLALGRALDLKGDHKSARQHLEQAIKLATDANRNQALAAMGISWAFESKPDETARYFQRIFDAQTQANDRGGAAGTANGLGRIYLESGNLDKAEQWYRTGYETARQIPEVPADQMALWEMRWHNAQARIAARRKNPAAAEKHVAEAAVWLDKSGNESQRVFQPYLTGYVAYYLGRYQQAIDDLLKGDQRDPFVLGLIAQAYEKLGDKARAREYYTKVLELPAHSINAAFALPKARAFLR